MVSSFHYELKHFAQLSALELYRILQLRIGVFIVEQNCPYQDCDDKDIEAHHLMAYDDKALVGTARVLAPGVSYDGYASIGRVVSKPSIRKKKVGMQLMEWAIRYCEQLYPGTPIKISAQSYLVEFYKKFGFAPVGGQYLEDNIPHQAMVRAVNKT